MTGLLHYADDVLRRRPWTTQSARTSVALKLLIALIFVFGMAYGAVMGCFGGVEGDRILQVFYSAVKVPLLLVATSLIALPNFFVLNTLFGLRRDFAESIRALAATQAGLAVILASMAPFTIVWYATSADYSAALRFNAIMFAVASFGAQILLRGYYQPLIRRNPPPSLDAVVLADYLHFRGHSDGLGAAPVHRRSQLARSILPRRGVEQRVCRGFQLIRLRSRPVLVSDSDCECPFRRLVGPTLRPERNRHVGVEVRVVEDLRVGFGVEGDLLEDVEVELAAEFLEIGDRKKTHVGRIVPGEVQRQAARRAAFLGQLAAVFFVGEVGEAHDRPAAHAEHVGQHARHVEHGLQGLREDDEIELPFDEARAGRG